MPNFSTYLQQQHLDAGLVDVLTVLADSVKEISVMVREDQGDKAGSENVFGELQMAADVKADLLIKERLIACEAAGLVASEEMEDEEKVGDGSYAVAHDPVDGSSLVDVNLSVGSIFGIYQTDTFYGVKGIDQVAALVAVYGPKTSIFVTVGKGTVYFVLNSDGQFVLDREYLKISPEGKMFAPGNLRACSQRADYLQLLNYWAENQYKLRYSGGMVPDIGQILLKGKGVFAYPGYKDQPEGKLRLLFECAPMAFLIEQAGGYASDGKMKILDKEVTDLAMRTPIFIGSELEVKKCEEMLA